MWRSQEKFSGQKVNEKVLHVGRSSKNFLEKGNDIFFRVDPESQELRKMSYTSYLGSCTYDVIADGGADGGGLSK